MLGAPLIVIAFVTSVFSAAPIQSSPGIVRREVMLHVSFEQVQVFSIHKFSQYTIHLRAGSLRAVC